MKKWVRPSSSCLFQFMLFLYLFQFFTLLLFRVIFILSFILCREPLLNDNYFFVMYLIFEKIFLIFLIFFIFCIDELCFDEEKNYLQIIFLNITFIYLFILFNQLTCVYFYYHLIG